MEDDPQVNEREEMRLGLARTEEPTRPSQGVERWRLRRLAWQSERTRKDMVLDLKRSRAERDSPMCSVRGRNTS